MQLIHTSFRDNNTHYIHSGFRTNVQLKSKIVKMIMLWTVVIGLLAIIYYQLVPNVLEPTLWQNPPPLLNFEGKLVVNDVLTNAQRAEGHYHGPESIAFDSELGTAYVSFGDGVVRSFSEHGQEKGPVFFTGGFINSSMQGNGLDSGHKSLRNWCYTESIANRLAWDTAGEKRCGRPLGIRFRKVRMQQPCIGIRLTYYYLTIIFFIPGGGNQALIHRRCLPWYFQAESGYTFCCCFGDT